ncbi:hypothetical protein [Bacillus wiedmannii]|uniref:hypothetical protein n=1 Tax=Bacillus wiedmannii TaxID=1890302 RepID=UPI000BF78D19|nr:hypothetical protein [Bacillus wiedmannii]PGA30313.1 hypothetical protein COL74_25635 [Bacillus wiedmannii]
MAFPINNLVLTSEQVSNGKGFILVGAKEWFEFDRETNKTTDKQLGMKYECVLPGLKFSKVIVKVEGTHVSDIFTDKDIEEEDGQIPVSFEGFEGKIYMNNSRQPDLSCKASKIEPLPLD